MCICSATYPTIDSTTARVPTLGALPSFSCLGGRLSNLVSLHSAPPSGCTLSFPCSCECCAAPTPPQRAQIQRSPRTPDTGLGSIFRRTQHSACGSVLG